MLAATLWMVLARRALRLAAAGDTEVVYCTRARAINMSMSDGAEPLRKGSFFLNRFGSLKGTVDLAFRHHLHELTQRISKARPEALASGQAFL